MATDNLTRLDEVRQRRARGGERPPAEPDARPTIRLAAGERVRAATEAEAALIEAGTELYKQGSRVVRVVWDHIKVAGGGDGTVLRIGTLDVAGILGAFERASHFEKWDGRAEDFVTADCPEKVAVEYLARDGAWELPYLLGVVTAPTLRPDGSVLREPGYDAVTGLVFDPAGTAFPEIPDEPTREDAMAALAVLAEPIALFPFATPEARSVALSGILTAVLRRALPTAPMHAFTAPTAGSGKSMLVDIAAIVATGERAAVTTTGNDGRNGDAELEKRLTASMLAGDAVLSIDNVEGGLGGELLCSLLTQPRAKLRPLGASVNVEVPVTTAFFATSNNLTVIGDMTRRVLAAGLDPGVERPELREFAFSPIALASRRRGELAAAAVTVARARVISTDPRPLTPIGGFEEWSRLIRDALTWLGEPDPCIVMEGVRRSDPRIAKIRATMNAWAEVFGDGPVTVRKVADECQRRSEKGEFERRELRDAITAVTGDRDPQPITGTKLSWWLRKNAGRLLDGRKFIEDETDAKYAAWRLEGGGAAPREPGEDDEIPF